MTTYPLPANPLSALTRADGTTEAHSVDHGRVIGIWENVKHHNAKGDGSSDDSAAFTAAATAAGPGGTVYAPTGTFVLDNWTPSSVTNIKGAGKGQTILKAKTAAAAAVSLTGLWHASISDVAIDGNVTAAKGLVIQGGAVAGSQGHLFQRVKFQNCSVGVHVTAGTVTQADKNVYLGCWWDTNTTGLWIDSVNAQEQIVIGGSLDSHTTAIRLSHGSLTFFGGQVQNATTSFLIDSTNVQWLSLRDVITEATTRDIDGRTAWPTQTVHLENSILQGSTSTVDMGVSGSNLLSRGCQFNTGAINSTANDTMWYSEFDTLASGAAWNPTGVNDRMIMTDRDGTHYYYNSTTAVGHAYTHGEFEGTKGLSTYVKAGVPNDGNFAHIVDGMIAVDSADNRLYVRHGGAWHWVALT